MQELENINGGKSFETSLSQTNEITLSGLKLVFANLVL